MSNLRSWLKSLQAWWDKIRRKVKPPTAPTDVPIVIPPILEPGEDDGDANTVPLDTFKFVSGDNAVLSKAKSDSEVYKILRGTSLRCTVNDSANRIPQSKGKYCFPKSSIVKAMLSAEENSAGDLVLEGVKGVHVVGNQKLRFCGWTLRTDAKSAPFVAQYRVVVPRSEVSGAMRGYLATVSE